MISIARAIGVAGDPVLADGGVDRTKDDGVRRARSAAVIRTGNGRGRLGVCDLVAAPPLASVGLVSRLVLETEVGRPALGDVVGSERPSPALAAAVIAAMAAGRQI